LQAGREIKLSAGVPDGQTVKAPHALGGGYDADQADQAPYHGLPSRRAAVLQERPREPRGWIE